MTGHLRQKNDAWYAVVYTGRSPSGNPKYKWHRLNSRGKREAQKELTALLNELNTGAYVDPAKFNLATYLQQWLHDYAESHVSKKTYERYAQLVRTQIVPSIGNINLGKLRATDITSMESEMLKTGKQRGKGGLSPRTVLHIHRLLRKSLQDAVLWQLIARNPADQVQPPRVPRKDMPTLCREDVVKMVTTTKGTRFYIPILLAISTGMRRGEIYGLRWEDIDFEHSTICVQRSLEETLAGELNLKEPKSGKGRQIVLPETVVSELRIHQKNQDEQKKLCPDWEDNGLVFCEPNGKMSKPELLSRQFKGWMKKSGLPAINFHSLRHTHATMLLQEGVHPKVVQERLGHSTISITMDIYSHVIPGMQEAAAQMINGCLGL